MNPNSSNPPMPTAADIAAVSPALARYDRELLHGELWDRPELSRRDRLIVTVAALIARNQGAALSACLNAALEGGVSPAELSEIVTHLAFYAGWPNAMSAVAIVRPIFAERGIGADRLPPASPVLLPLDEAAEAQRAATVGGNFGAVSPGVVHYTTEALFRDLWLRPDLAPRDRSLVTVAALVASGQTAQITYHLGRAMDHGLTREQAGEMLAHLAFHVGWPPVFSALPVVKDVLEKRP